MVLDAEKVLQQKVMCHSVLGLLNIETLSRPFIL